MLEWLISTPPDADLTPDQLVALGIINAEAAQRLERLGETGSGLYDYYAKRLERGELFSEYDLAAAAFVRAQRPRWKRIWEIGAGIGQLGALLAVAGFEVVSVEHNGKRFEAMRALADRLANEFPGLSERWQLHCADFPATAANDDIGTDLAVVFGCATGSSEDELSAFRLRLAAFNSALIDFSTLGTWAPGEELGRLRRYQADTATANAIPVFRHHRPGRTDAWTAYLVGRAEAHETGRALSDSQRL